MLKIDIVASEDTMNLIRRALEGAVSLEDEKNGFSIELGEAFGDDRDLVLTVNLSEGEDTAEVTNVTEEQIDEPSDVEEDTKEEE